MYITLLKMNWDSYFTERIN